MKPLKRPKKNLRPRKSNSFVVNPTRYKMRLSQLGFNCVVGLLFCCTLPYGVLWVWRFIFSQFPWYLTIAELFITLTGVIWQTSIIYFMGALGKAIHEGTDGSGEVNLNDPQSMKRYVGKACPHQLAALALIIYFATHFINGDMTSGISHLNSSVMGMFSEPSIQIQPNWIPA
jgi:hypothetical protein